MKAIIVSLVLIATVGCSTQRNLTELVKALAKDPATVNINLSSVYGTLRFERYVPSATNVVVMPLQWGAPFLTPQETPTVTRLAPAPGLFWTPATNAVK